ncbi:MAG: hypothetical protein Q9P01_11540 [Anaerolineae bacterium]|nr:hypothetical protein [Anaerolineae bacterium]
MNEDPYLSLVIDAGQVQKLSSLKVVKWMMTALANPVLFATPCRRGVHLIVTFVPYGTCQQFQIAVN